MFKPVHGVRGTLKTALTSFADTIVVDDSTLIFLRKMLTSPDYTYLLIRTDYSYEIVKTAGFTGNTISVLRGQDGTVAQAFPIGAEVEFVLGNAAISDIVTQQMLGQINIQGDGIVTVTKLADNDYLISAPAITIESESDKILVGGEFPNFIISTPLLRDCCD